MKRAIRAAISPLLAGLGIHPGQYWLLVDLFQQLSERREVLSNLGQDGATMKVATWIYFGLSTLAGVLMLAGQAAVGVFFTAFLAMTGFLLFMILLAETGNSLINPVEGLVLAHQPVDGATYTAAKLSHLLRIVGYLVTGLNAAPAVLGWGLKSAHWWYPAAHLAAAFAVGLTMAALCCSLFGYLVRFVPPARLRTAGQVADLLPWLMMFGMQFAIRPLMKLGVQVHWPQDPAWQWGLGAGTVLVGLLLVALGVRSLSADYLLRVWSIAHGGASRRRRVRRSRTGELAARWLGGPAARAGFEFVRMMAARDWQLRKQLIPCLAGIIPPIGMVISDWPHSPFSAEFAYAHFIPHLIGVVLFFVCMCLSYGTDYKSVWVFQLASERIFDRFAAGAYALLWTRGVALPNLVLLPLFCWGWGLWQGALFTAFSAALASVYLALEIRLVQGVPFGRQFDARRQQELMGVIVLSLLVISVVVAAQHFLLFRSPLMVAAATAAAAAGAWWLTRRSVEAFAETIRFQLGTDARQAGDLYVEI